ncbi:MAG: ice-binding family protein [Candidatus Moranbacteria bacterium]|nr:ice-binding family protein [Candidatus Moranbacteria bacterium]
MKKFNWIAMVVVLAFATALGFSGKVNAATQVDLGTADDFAILAGTPNITDAGHASAITGNVGLSPATAAGIGLWCSQMSGVSTIYGVNSAYVGDGIDTSCFKGTAPDKTLVDKAKTDLETAYDDASGQGPGTIIPTELGGQTLSPGVYSSANTRFQITEGAGHLILDGQGDSNAVFIFEMGFDGTGLTVGPNGAEVELIGSAQACNVFWRVNTATINTTAVFVGNILALNSITVANGARVDGSLLARDGNVTLDHNTITNAVCKAPDDSSNDNKDNDSNHVDISVRKRATPSALYSGPGLVTYTYDVRNEGDNALKFVSIKDDKCSPVKFVSGDGDHDSKLDTNERWRYTCTKIVSQTETNTATVRGTNGKEVKDTAKATVTVSVPGLPNAGIGPDEENSSLWETVIQKVSSFFNSFAN